MGAMGAASLFGATAVQAFVAPSASSSSSTALRGAAIAQTEPSVAGASQGQAAAATAVATAALALVSSRRAARGKTARRAEATGVTDEKPFAGGLIGGESAFAGQDFNFDPLGLSVKCEKYLPWFRESELKHGRTGFPGPTCATAIDIELGRIPHAFAFLAWYMTRSLLPARHLQDCHAGMGGLGRARDRARSWHASLLCGQERSRSPQCLCRQS